MAGRAEVMKPEALVHDSAWGTGTSPVVVRLGMNSVGLERLEALVHGYGSAWGTLDLPFHRMLGPP